MSGVRVFRKVLPPLLPGEWTDDHLARVADEIVVPPELKPHRIIGAGRGREPAVRGNGGRPNAIEIGDPSQRCFRHQVPDLRHTFVLFDGDQQLVMAAKPDREGCDLETAPQGSDRATEP